MVWVIFSEQVLVKFFEYGHKSYFARRYRFLVLHVYCSNAGLTSTSVMAAKLPNSAK